METIPSLGGRVGMSNKGRKSPHTGIVWGKRLLKDWAMAIGGKVTERLFHDKRLDDSMTLPRTQES